MTYKQNDRSMLGAPPWKPTDPALQGWEGAHGHDVRLDCDWDCLIVQSDHLAAQSALDLMVHHFSPKAVENAIAVLRRLRGEE